MPFMNEALDTLLKKVEKISQTGEIVDFHRLVDYKFMFFYLEQTQENGSTNNSTTCYPADRALFYIMFCYLFLASLAHVDAIRTPLLFARTVAL